MLEFEANAARLRELMTAEAKEGERDPEVDRELAELRAAWKRLPDSDKQMAGQISSSLGDLVLGRPAAPDGADPGPEASEDETDNQRPGCVPGKPGLAVIELPFGDQGLNRGGEHSSLNVHLGTGDQRELTELPNLIQRDRHAGLRLEYASDRQRRGHC